MAEYIIPRQAFCNRFVTAVEPENKYRILGYPVCIKNEEYERNEFMFNFCLVIEVEVDKTPYEAVVRRLASTFIEMETQNQFLSSDTGEGKGEAGGRRSIKALIEIIKEDLNNYNECMIPVGKSPLHISSHTLGVTFLMQNRRCQYNQYEALPKPQISTASKSMARSYLQNQVRGDH